MRLIDADALIPLIKMGECNMYDEYCQGRNGGIEFAVNQVKQMPTIELERKTGRWTKAYDGNDDHVKCTGCFKTYDWISQAQYYNYCPNCGAYMGGDTE